ncbi:MAG: recombinase family protein [Bacillota bacterium]|nr:recombinase family protein [Bacillota bacterium]
MRVALYARASSGKQGVDHSISGQMNSLRDYAVAKGHQVAGEYRDEARGGCTSERPQLRRLIAATGGAVAPFDAVLVLGRSRLARGQRDVSALEALLTKRGVRVISACGEP